MYQWGWRDGSVAKSTYGSSEGHSSVSSIQIRWLPTAWDSSSRGSDGHCGYCMQVPHPTHSYIYKIKNPKKVIPYNLNY